MAVGFQRYTAADGLAHDMIWSLHWDGAILWVGTQNGVFSFERPIREGHEEDLERRFGVDLWIGSLGKLGHYRAGRRAIRN